MKFTDRYIIQNVPNTISNGAVNASKFPNPDKYKGFTVAIARILVYILLSTNNILFDLFYYIGVFAMPPTSTLFLFSGF